MSVIICNYIGNFNIKDFVEFIAAGATLLLAIATLISVRVIKKNQEINNLNIIEQQIFQLDINFIKEKERDPQYTFTDSQKEVLFNHYDYLAALVNKGKLGNEAQEIFGSRLISEYGAYPDFIKKQKQKQSDAFENLEKLVKELKRRNHL